MSSHCAKCGPGRSITMLTGILGRWSYPCLCGEGSAWVLKTYSGQAAHMLRFTKYKKQESLKYTYFETAQTIAVLVNVVAERPADVSVEILAVVQISVSALVTVVVFVIVKVVPEVGTTRGLVAVRVCGRIVVYAFVSAFGTSNP